MNSILVPVDFSESSLKAFKYAIQLAKIFNFKVILHNVFIYPVPSYAELPYPVQEVNKLMKVHQRSLNHLKKAASKILGENVEAVLTEAYSSATDSIIQLSEKKDVAFIVMGAGEHHGLLEKIFGSVSTGVLKMSQIPVFVIPENYRWKPISKILVGVEETSFYKKNIIQALLEINENLDAEIVLVKIEGIGDYFNGAGQYDKDEINSRLPHDIQMLTYAMDENKARGLNEVADDLDAGLIITFGHRRNLIERIIFGSTSRKLALMGRKPLLMIPDHLSPQRITRAFEKEHGNLAVQH